MPTSQMSQAIDQLRSAVLRDGAGLPDGELLDRFVRLRDAAALAALVQRHSAMVWGVCRRILSSHHDAEDAFQATFLVLVRKADSLKKKELLANWLYGVAQQTAFRARGTMYKQAARERQVIDMPEPAAAVQESWDAIQPLLDQELSRLPDKYRSLIVLCDLEGKTRKEAAELLDCPEGTIAGRLARARAMLAKRLARHGIVTTAVALGTVLSLQAASASAPAAVVTSTIQAASLYAAGCATAAGAISANAVALSEGVVKAMFMTKLKMTAAYLMVLGVLALSGGAVGQYLLAGDAPDQPGLVVENDLAPLPEEEFVAEQRPQPKQEGVIVAGKLESIDAGAVTISTLKRGEAPVSKTYTLAKDAKIQRDGKDAAIGDLRKGSQATLKLTADQKTAVSVSVGSQGTSAPLKAIDAAKRTITVTIGTRLVKEDKTFDVAKDAKIMIDGKESGLADLKQGAVVQFFVNDSNTITMVRTATAKVRRQDQ